MTLFNELKREIGDTTNFWLFTKLLKAKIVGGLLSKEKLTEQEKDIIKTVGFVEQRIIFNCPHCKRRQHANIVNEEVECDCRELINIKAIPKESRYRLQEDIFNGLEDHFSRENNGFIFIFGKKNICVSNHNSKVCLHISPFLNTDKKFECLNDAHLDHFSISWGLFPIFLDDKLKAELFTEISRFRDEEIEKQIDYSGIDESKFQDLVLELLRTEKKFSKIIPGGKGPDQGKDAFGYSTIMLPTGKPKEIKTLIQCKHTEKDYSFSTDDIQKYVTKSKRHKCNSLLFVTNGTLSGDTVTEINSGAYNDNVFFDVDFWDKNNLFDLLRQHHEIRIDYFYKANKKVNV